MKYISYLTYLSFIHNSESIILCLSYFTISYFLYCIVLTNVSEQPENDIALSINSARTHLRWRWYKVVLTYKLNNSTPTRHWMDLCLFCPVSFPWNTKYTLSWPLILFDILRSLVVFTQESKLIFQELYDVSKISHNNLDQNKIISDKEVVT